MRLEPRRLLLKIATSGRDVEIRKSLSSAWGIFKIFDLRAFTALLSISALGRAFTSGLEDPAQEQIWGMMAMESTYRPDQECK